MNDGPIRRQLRFRWWGTDQETRVLVAIRYILNPPSQKIRMCSGNLQKLSTSHLVRSLLPSEMWFAEKGQKEKYQFLPCTCHSINSEGR